MRAVHAPDADKVASVAVRMLGGWVTLCHLPAYHRSEHPWRHRASRARVGQPPAACTGGCRATCRRQVSGCCAMQAPSTLQRGQEGGGQTAEIKRGEEGARGNCARGAERRKRDATTHTRWTHGKAAKQALRQPTKPRRAAMLHCKHNLRQHTFGSFGMPRRSPLHRRRWPPSEALLASDRTAPPPCARNWGCRFSTASAPVGPALTSSLPPRPSVLSTCLGASVARRAR